MEADKSQGGWASWRPGRAEGVSFTLKASRLELQEGPMLILLPKAGERQSPGLQAAKQETFSPTQRNDQPFVLSRFSTRDPSTMEGHLLDSVHRFTSKNTLTETSRIMTDQISGCPVTQSHKLHHCRGARDSTGPRREHHFRTRQLRFKFQLFSLLAL